MISVHFLGFESKFIKSMSISIANRVSDICRVSTKLNSDVIIVDIDNYTNLDVLSGKESQIIAISSIGFSDNKYRFVVPKPLVFTQLIKFIQLIGGCDSKLNKLESNIAKKNEDTQLITKVLESEHYLLGLFQDDLKKGSNEPILYSWSLDHWILLDKSQNKVHLGMQESTLKNLVFQTLDKHNLHVKRINNTELENLKPHAFSSLDIERFLWKLTKFTLRGALIAPLNTTNHYHLKYYPNAIQYANSSSEMAMASLLCARSCSAQEIKNLLNLKLEEVVSFLSCSYMCGLLETGIKNNKPNEKFSNKFLGMILNKLGF